MRRKKIGVYLRSMRRILPTMILTFAPRVADASIFGLVRQYVTIVGSSLLVMNKGLKKRPKEGVPS